MPSLPKPSFSFNYNPNSEIIALRHYRDNEPNRQIPLKADDRLLVATWNIANLGLHKRKPKDHRIMAEIMINTRAMRYIPLDEDMTRFENCRPSPVFTTTLMISPAPAHAQPIMTRFLPPLSRASITLLGVIQPVRSKKLMTKAAMVPIKAPIKGEYPIIIRIRSATMGINR